MITRVRLLLIGTVVALLATACQVGVHVKIEVAEDGSGLVTVAVSLDQEAVDEIREQGQTVVVDDMEAAGWAVTGPEVEDDGLTWIRATKPFNSPEQLTPIMEEIDGADGAFRGFVLLREKSFGELTFTLTGLVDLTAGPTGFTDSAVEEVLGDNFDVASRLEQIVEEYGPIDDNVTVTLTVQLPGGTDGGTATDDGATWVVRFSDSQPTQVAASGSEENLSATLWRWVGIGALVLAGIAAVIYLISWLLGRRTKKRGPYIRPPQQAGSAVPLAARGQMPAQAAPPVAPPAGQPRRDLRLVVLDPTSVVFDLADDPRRRLLPFVRGRGSEVPDAEVVEAYREASLGRLGASEFWAACGVEGDAADLDLEYVSSVSTRPGAHQFLAEMHRREMDVALLGNTRAEWAQLLRNRDGFDSVSAWIISGEVGVRNPDPGILEALRNQTGVPFEGCLLIDGRVINLDAARTVGMGTALFADVRPPADQQPNHPVVTNFSEFFRRR